MIGYALFKIFGNNKIAFGKKIGNEFRMMHDIEIAAEITPFILDRIEAMRASGDDLLNVLSVQRLNIFFDQSLR